MADWQDTIAAAAELNRRIQEAQAAQRRAQREPEPRDSHHHRHHHPHHDNFHYFHHRPEPRPQYDHRHEVRVHYDHRPEPRPQCNHHHDSEIRVIVEESDPSYPRAYYPEVRHRPNRPIHFWDMPPPRSMVEEEHYLVQRINEHNGEAEKRNNRIHPHDFSAVVIPKMCMLGPHHGKYPPFFQNDMTLRQMDLYLDTYQLTAILNAYSIPIPWYHTDRRPRNFSTRSDYRYRYHNRIAEMKERKLHALLEFLGVRVGP